jgi:hypothetical protein
MTIYVNKHSQPFIPFTPDYMSWEDWNGNMIIYFGQVNIPHTDEANWKQTADVLCSTLLFSAYPLPDADRYDNWQDWAMEVTTIVNGKSH